MNIQSILVLLLVGLGVVAALRSGKKKASHGCKSDCKRCGGKCGR